MRDKKLTELVSEVYSCHKQLLDYIYYGSQKNRMRSIRQTISDYLEGKGYRVGTQDPWVGGFHLKFYTEKMKQYIYFNKTLTDWRKRETFAFNVLLKPDEKAIEVSLTMNKKGDKTYCREQLHKVLAELEEPIEEQGQYEIYRRKPYSFDIYQSEENILKQFEAIFDKYEPEIKKVMSHLHANGDELRGLKREAEEKDASAS